MTVEPEKLESAVAKSNVIALGPGLGNTKETFLFLMRIAKELRNEGKSDTVLILDADGLNVLEGKTALLENIGVNIIITPHFGEMARLTGLDIDYIRENRVDVAKDFAKKHKVVVILKGNKTVVTDGDKVFINSTGSSAMASGGMGDALTGILAALSKQTNNILETALCGTFLHGYVGDKIGEFQYSVNATDIIEAIPMAMKELSNKK